MLRNNSTFSSFSVDDIVEAEEFYGVTLGLEVEATPQGLDVHLAGGSELFIYPKDTHEPATFTVLNFIVDDIDRTVDDLKELGVVFEQYTGMMQTDEKGIARSVSEADGPTIAWFKDPAGNILSIIQS